MNNEQKVFLLLGVFCLLMALWCGIELYETINKVNEYDF